ncbi:MAG: cytidine deaminase [Deltaproteobacteria bacterium CG11_big_fil_rev_8_21_14_0_20_49_13]|nr:MAG: cytidine deaminase [Deltaproteobacteria bacterium CG11_big_fil_rev_8_21_14_0_20_49_13]
MNKLIEEALKARKKAYAPYSRFKVGAALEALNGKIYTGCNVENASYGLSVCAERTAIFKAVSEGATKFRRIAIATGAIKALTPPCGACRQILAEFNPRLEIILANSNGRIKKANLKKLMPDPFLPASLKKGSSRI